MERSPQSAPKPSAATRRAFEALRQQLREASAEGFARIEAPEVGERLRQALARFVETGGRLGQRPAEQSTFADGLARFEGMGRHDRSVVVAHGMRLCMGWSDPAAPEGVSGRKRSGKRVARHRASSAAAVARGATGGSAGDPSSNAEAVKSKATKSKATKSKATKSKATTSKTTKSKTTTNKAAKSTSVDDEPPLAHAPVTVLPRVGPSTATKLAGRGLETLEDLVFFLPSGYRDHREHRRPHEADEGEVISIEATVERFRQGFARGRAFASAEVVDDEGTPVSLRWFHRVGGLGQRMTEGARVVVVGAIRPYRNQLSIVHPEVYPADDPPPPITVRYPVVEGVGARTISNLCRRALEHLLQADALEDVLPAALIRQHHLPPLTQALRLLHDPPPSLSPDEVRALAAGRSPAHRRLAFGELLLLQLLLLRRRGQWCTDAAAFVTPEHAFDPEVLRACLPFEPTAAQWRVIDELEQDMASGRPMLRLLQGDVGSGKTAVAFAAIRAVTAAGGQAALMAPTELLAEQHLRTLTPWCEAAGLRVSLLTGAMPKGQRSSLLALLAAGEIDLLVGTHALLVGDVHFAGLGLVVVDEQHRFGVEQRALLRAKGERPHLLVMTATPIPRTLALTAYGELEVSLIDELPPGRQPPVTRLLAGRPALTRARTTLAKAVRRGAQAFVVCPLVEASEAIDASHVEASAAAIRALLPDVEVGVVHGRMPPEDKDAVMEAFRSGRSQVLVATTVIEVGVDVPAARAILVEHAERFGLAQLHQLRGRIGRGGGASLCLVHTAGGPKSESAQRLGILTETADGFAVAEHDLAQRGPGEIFGTRQAGVPRLRFLGFAGDGTRMLVQARAAAQALLDEDPELSAHPRLRYALEQRERDAPVYSADAG
ncbi:MAG: ATP-dependent DNA helicase RecG [Myxococcota bacterium]